MTDLAGLIERLERCEGPDRGLDAEIVVALDIRPEWLKADKGELWVDLKGDTGPCVRFRAACIPKRSRGNPPAGVFLEYTSSIDASLPDENIVSMVRLGDGHPWKVTAVDANGIQYGGESVVNEAIARRIAALRARMAA